MPATPGVTLLTDFYVLSRVFCLLPFLLSLHNLPVFCLAAVLILLFLTSPNPDLVSLRILNVQVEWDPVEWQRTARPTTSTCPAGGNNSGRHRLRKYFSCWSDSTCWDFLSRDGWSTNCKRNWRWVSCLCVCVCSYLHESYFFGRITTLPHSAQINFMCPIKFECASQV